MAKNEFAEFVETYRVAGRTSTAKTYTALLQPFARWLAEHGKGPSDFTHEDVSSYLAQRMNLQPRSKNTFLAAVKKFAKWYNTYKIDASQPQALVEHQRRERITSLSYFPVEHPLERKVLTVDEIKRVLEVAEPKDCAIIYLLAYFGLRKNELKTITNTDFERNILHVMTEKSRAERILPFNETAGQALKLVRERGWLGFSPSTLNKRFAKYNSLLNGVKLEPHNLRRSFNANMRRRIPDYLLRVLMGHSEKSMTDRYDEPFMAELCEAMTVKHYMNEVRLPTRVFREVS
jgi:integrase